MYQSRATGFGQPRWGRRMGGGLGPRAQAATCPFTTDVEFAPSEYTQQGMNLAAPGLGSNASGIDPKAVTLAVVLGGLGVAAVGVGSMVGITYAHRKKGRSWYCSLMPSAFWSSLITGAAATAVAGTVVALKAREFAQ